MVTLCQRRPKHKASREQNPESRAKEARWNRTLTFILSLAGRGEEAQGPNEQGGKANSH